MASSKWTEERITKVLAGIQARVPPLWLKMAVTEQSATPELERLIDLALGDPDYPEEKKRNLQILKDAGEFSKKIPIENPKYTKLIDQFVQREIKKAMKSGLLPPKDKIKNLPHVKQIYDKIQKDFGKKE